MQAEKFLSGVRNADFFVSQVAHVQVLPERPARFAPVSGGLNPAVEKALANQGISQLYSHQAEAIEKVRAGSNVVIVTGTASGKTLCYTIPVVETLLGDRMATMLFIYPTKALAQDQLRKLGAFQLPDEGMEFLCGTYDGDTPQTLRRKLRDRASIILTNPDMLNQGILPQHGRWNRVFSHLRYVVIDEVHAYRGVFGSHLASLMRRLRRVCRHYGSSPQFICCSATIANPREHAESICGAPMELVDDDGAPRGPKRFVLWNPPPIETAARGGGAGPQAGGDRRSSLWEAVYLMSVLVKEGVQTIAFVRTRLAAELIFKNCRDQLRPVSRRLSESIRAYRGGYLPEERRDIERRLVSKEILGVSSTNALELGIDIGSLDASIIVGYPGTIASLWQQAGRAGRGRDESLVFLIAQNSPIDQYLMLNSEYVFAQTPEQAVVDPDNPHIVVDHIKCAMYEMPLGDDELQTFGPYAQTILELLEEKKTTRHIEGLWYWAGADYPASDMNLRNIAGPVYTIQDEAAGERVIGTMDEVSALSQLHDHAVYLHGAETYFVNKLDLEQKVARVEKRDLDYYTQAVTQADIRVEQPEIESAWQGGPLGFGDVVVTTSIPMFKKIRFHSRDSLGFEKLELPPQRLETVAFWFSPPEQLAEEMKKQKMVVGEALAGVANVLLEVAPLFVMCDPVDVGTTVDSAQLGRDALFFYDRYPGGMGYARRCMERMDEIMPTIYAVVRDCGCVRGCPSCVGAPITPFAMTDLDSAVRGRIPDKQAARFMLEHLLPPQSKTRANPKRRRKP